MKIILVTLTTFLFLPNLIFCQFDLSIFDELIGKKWVGHYQDSEDFLLTHYINWKYDLENHIVVQEKEVPEANFKSITYYYLNYEQENISFVCIMNKDMISKGNCSIENDKIVLLGKLIFNQDIRISYKLLNYQKLEN